MKILLDECLPVDFRHCLRGHEVHTVQWLGLKGIKNGELLIAAESAGYEAFLTVDQGIPFQQRIVERKLSVVIIQARTNQMEDLLPLVETILRTLETIDPGAVTQITPPGDTLD